MVTPTARVTRKYPISEIAVSTGPRGTVNDTTAKASVMPAASTNQRCRPNKLIRLSFYGYQYGFPDRFRSTTHYFRHTRYSPQPVGESFPHDLTPFGSRLPAKIPLSVGGRRFGLLGALLSGRRAQNPGASWLSRSPACDVFAALPCFATW